MKIRKRFLQLTRYTYPYGTERFLESFLPNGYKTDKFGNYYVSIGEDSTTMFTCHLDTSCSKMSQVMHRFSGRYIMTDGKTILGADDKAGMVVILYMIEKKIPGLYYFFIGEESGCIGSSDLAEELEKDGDIPLELKTITKCVSFDRRGTTSVITNQFYGDCCSDEFAEGLCNQLNIGGKLKMVPDNTGILTDSAQFMGIIPECTNISVGYYNEHMHTERQDIDFLYKLCSSVVNVDWESLPIHREPQSGGFGGGCNGGYYGGGAWGDWDDWDSPSDFSSFGTAPIQRPIDPDAADYFEDLYSYVIKDGIRQRAYISKTWINHEIILISKMLERQGRNVDDIKWDGTSLWVREAHETQNEYVGNRSDIIEFIDTFGQIPVAHLKYGLIFERRGTLVS